MVVKSATYIPENTVDCAHTAQIVFPYLHSHLHNWCVWEAQSRSCRLLDLQYCLCKVYIMFRLWRVQLIGTSFKTLSWTLRCLFYTVNFDGNDPLSVVIVDNTLIHHIKDFHWAHSAGKKIFLAYIFTWSNGIGRGIQQKQAFGYVCHCGYLHWWNIMFNFSLYKKSLFPFCSEITILHSPSHLQLSEHGNIAILLR